MAEIITVDDLPASVRDAVDTADLTLMVAGANARASRVAPCLAGTGDDAPTGDQLAEARLVLVGAIKRWAETGSGAAQTVQSGPFSQTVDTRQRTGYNLWPSEITELAAICSSTTSSGRAFEIDTAPEGSGDGYWSAPDTWVPYTV